MRFGRLAWPRAEAADWKRGGGSSASPPIIRPADRADNKKDLLNHDAFTACDASKFTAIDPAERIKEGKAAEIYKLMIGIIVPRPIAFVSSMDAEGRKSARAQIRRC